MAIIAAKIKEEAHHVLHHPHHLPYGGPQPLARRAPLGGRREAVPEALEVRLEDASQRGGGAYHGLRQRGGLVGTAPHRGVQRLGYRRVEASGGDGRMQEDLERQVLRGLPLLLVRRRGGGGAFLLRRRHSCRARLRAVVLHVVGVIGRRGGGRGLLLGLGCLLLGFLAAEVHEGELPEDGELHPAHFGDDGHDARGHLLQR
mmetsp:Transcript_37404/g.105572  ORF Transcript_37404/g.105572 Transcript_37404/m.105572 type:complete len:202 (-) Transcript_37404:2687-3292(-)